MQHQITIKNAIPNTVGRRVVVRQHASKYVTSLYYYNPATINLHLSQCSLRTRWNLRRREKPTVIFARIPSARVFELRTRARARSERNNAYPRTSARVSDTRACRLMQLAKTLWKIFPHFRNVQYISTLSAVHRCERVRNMYYVNCCAII